MIKTAFLLSAGRGERMRPLSDHLPKCLLPVKKKPLIVYLIEAFAREGIRHIVMNVSYKAEQIQAALKNGQDWGVKIDYAHEEIPLETGGGIAQALPLIKSEWFWVVSSDIYTDYAFKKNLWILDGDVPDKSENLLNPARLAHLILIPEPVSPLKPDFDLDSRHYITPIPRHVYGSMGLFSKSFFKEAPLGRFKLVDLLHRHIEKRRLTGELYKGVWHNTGTVKDYERLLNL